MVRGLIAGLGTGVVVAAAGLAGLSVMSPLPPQRGQQEAPEGAVSGGQPPHLADVRKAGEKVAPPGGPAAAPGLSVPAGSEFARAAGDAVPQAPAAEGTPAPREETPSVPTQPEAGSAALKEGATPPEPPKAGADVARPEAPAVAGETPVPAPEAGVPVPPPGAAKAPVLPLAGSAAPEQPAEIVLLPDGRVLSTASASVRVNRPGEKAEGPDLNAAAPTAEPRFQRPPGAEAAPATGAADEKGAEPSPEAKVIVPPQAPALRRFAAAFEAPAGKPLISVVLVDVGETRGGLDPVTLSALDVPLTIAIDPTRPGAAEAAARYRKAGKEVAILAAPLPKEATAEDVSAALAAWGKALPEAVAVAEPADPVFRGDRQLAGPVVSGLASAGEGLVTWPGNGFDTAAQIAHGKGVPVASGWKVLDDDRPNGQAIGAALSRAAFEAKLRGNLTVVLHSWPESVAGLTDWASDIPEGKVALAPVSTLLLSAGAQTGN